LSWFRNPEKSKRRIRFSTLKVARRSDIVGRFALPRLETQAVSRAAE
jgi:hypothetical protein